MSEQRYAKILDCSDPFYYNHSDRRRVGQVYPVESVGRNAMGEQVVRLRVDSWLMIMVGGAVKLLSPLELLAEAAE